MDIPLSTNQVVSQRGAALIVSLVMLAAVTLIGVFVMSNSHLEWLMTNNSRFQSDAFMLAEATLQAAEVNIPPDPAAVAAWGNPLYKDDVPNSDTMPSDPNQLSNWAIYTTPASSASATIGAPAGTTNNYVIDYVGCTVQPGSSCGDALVNTTYTYQVWARSISADGAARIIRATYTVWHHGSGGTDLPDRIGFAEIAS